MPIALSARKAERQWGTLRSEKVICAGPSTLAIFDNDHRLLYPNPHALLKRNPAMSASEEDIYAEHVLDHYEDPYHRGPLDTATHTDEGKNPLCGDVVHIDLKMDDDGKIVEAWFEGDGCVISQASASMLMEKIDGKTLEEVQAFTADEMLELFGHRLTPNRQKCCLLSWRILQGALKSPVATDDDADESNGARRKFGGPTLGEET